MKKAIANPPKKVAGGGRNIVERILRHDKNGDRVIQTGPVLSLVWTG